MELNQIITKLQKDLPDFKYEAGNRSENANSVRIERDGQEIYLNLSKVQDEKDYKQLKDYIEGLWKQVEQ